MDSRKIIYMILYSLAILGIWYVWRKSQVGPISLKLFGKPLKQLTQKDLQRAIERSQELKARKLRGPMRFSLPSHPQNIPRVLTLPGPKIKLTAPQFFKRAVSIKGPLKFPMKVVPPPIGKFRLGTGDTRLALINQAGTLPFFKWKESEMMPARDQLNCGSCWAFAITGAASDQIALKAGIRDFLSPQELVDCTHAYAPSGDNCDGNDIQAGLDYAERYGVSWDSDYPYAKSGYASMGTCKPSTKKVFLKNVRTVGAGSEWVENIKAAIIAYGPVTAYIEVYSDLYNYDQRYGIYRHTGGGSSLGGHSVEIYGWCNAGINTAERGMTGAYWYCKNSWGTEWNNGWFYMPMGENHCQIESYVQAFEVEIPEKPGKTFYSSFTEYCADPNHLNWRGPEGFSCGVVNGEELIAVFTGEGVIDVEGDSTQQQLFGGLDPTTAGDIAFGGALVAGDIYIATKK